MMTPELSSIPYVDLAGQHQPLKEELLQAVAQVIDSGQFILGSQVDRFELQFAELVGVKHAIGVANGTDALILALRALNIGPGDEVITVPNSFVATAAAIALVGARPVFVDVTSDLNIDVTQIEAAITARTKAIMPVHLTGRPAEMPTINAIAEKYRLSVIEDAAQAVLAARENKQVGAWGTLGCFSLHPLKTLNALGDGGVVTTNNDHLADRIRNLRNLGLKTREQCIEWSGNSRLDTMQAAMLLVKLKYLQSWTDRRRENAALYRRLLADLPESHLRLPAEDDRQTFSVYHTFVVQAQRRDELKRFLLEKGIQTSIHYPIPIHQQIAGQSLGYPSGRFPVAESQAQTILSLPIYPELTDQQIRRIAQAIRAFYQG